MKGWGYCSLHSTSKKLPATLSTPRKANGEPDLKWVQISSSIMNHIYLIHGANHDANSGLFGGVPLSGTVRGRQVMVTSRFPIPFLRRRHQLVSRTAEKATKSGDWVRRGRSERLTLPPRGGGHGRGRAGVSAPPRGGVAPAPRARARAGLRSLQRGGQRARCICAGRCPKRWRCRWGCPPAPRRSGRTVSAARTRASKSGEDWRLARGFAGAPVPAGTRWAEPARAAEAWDWGWGRNGGKSQGRRPEVLEVLGSREPLQRGFGIRTRLPGFESWSWASAFACVLISKLGTEIVVNFNELIRS